MAIVRNYRDAGNNLEGLSILEDRDSLIKQLKAAGKNKAAFVGDNTWMSVFLDTFGMAFPHDSYDVEDLHTVGVGVLEHLFHDSKSFKFFPSGQFLAKLQQTNYILGRIIDKTQFLSYWEIMPWNRRTRAVLASIGRMLEDALSIDAAQIMAHLNTFRSSQLGSELDEDRKAIQAAWATRQGSPNIVISDEIGVFSLELLLHQLSIPWPFAFLPVGHGSQPPQPNVNIVVADEIGVFLSIRSRVAPGIVPKRMLPKANWPCSLFAAKFTIPLIDSLWHAVAHSRHFLESASFNPPQGKLGQMLNVYTIDIMACHSTFIWRYV
ncbi:hypothetical protein BDN70DRAFT_980053 [Pholiota conissans]|uniref:Uncharacterized protein n=1 Tax=Pholiota conissans TaxID=109636 RepID=A0A9P6CL97_9AGAR|nr:hypothetical protein BDN70DRAFT_980053 [Pholiota conissans]